MRTFLILLGKELRAYFFSPVAYIVLGLVMVLVGLSFNAAIVILEATPSKGSLVTWTFQSPWFFLSFFAIFPLITMRLFAEEQRLGTLETLLTAPVRTSQLVLAKFVAAVVFYAFLWLPSLANFAIFQWVTAGAADIPPGSFVGSYVIILAVGFFNVAMGCFASALTRNQLIAAILCFTLCIMHFLLGALPLLFADKVPEHTEELLSYFATVEHLRIFTSGLIDTRPLVYYLSFTALFLMLTHQVLEYRRWKV